MHIILLQCTDHFIFMQSCSIVLPTLHLLLEMTNIFVLFGCIDNPDWDEVWVSFRSLMPCSAILWSSHTTMTSFACQWFFVHWHWRWEWTSVFDVNYLTLRRGDGWSRIRLDLQHLPVVYHGVHPSNHHVTCYLFISNFGVTEDQFD